MGKLQVSGLEFDFLTTADIFALTPVNNEIRFNSDDGFYYQYNGTKWLRLTLGSELLNTWFQENFESGSFATNGWVTVQGGENDWFVDTAENNGGTYAAYISNNAGVAAAYSSVGPGLDISHVYIDILMPSGPLSNLVLEFDWKCEGEVGFDAGIVYNEPTSTTPIANTQLPNTNKIGLAQYNNQSLFTKEQINLPTSQAGTTRRIVFSWRNDSSIENNPPMVIDNVKILYN